MSTIFRFPVPRHTPPINRDTLIIEHLEDIFLLGQMQCNGVGSNPTSTSSAAFEASNIKILFENPGAHYWTPQLVTTTKIELHNIRSAGNVDEFYDIDVLRMTEPRLLFIQRTLSRLNRLAASDISYINTIKNVKSGLRSSVVEAFQDHLSCIASNFDFYENEKQIEANSYKFRKFPDNDNPIPIDRKQEGKCIFESFIESFSKLVSIEVSGEKVIAFSVHNERDWLIESQGEPFEVLGVLSRDCNAKCDFCYVLGNPNNTAIKLQKFTTQKSGSEAETRVRYFSEGKSLPMATYDTEELMTHPKFFDICKEIRRSSDKCISITTNGYKINSETVEKLKALAPIDISLSLNSQSPEIRSWLMGGPYARGLNALELLHQHRIPAALTIAAWPRVPVSEIEATIRHAAQFNLRSISVLLGGFTKFFPNPPEYPIPGYWNSVIDAIAHVREEIAIPLIIQPRLYEEQYRFPSKIGACLVTGINPGSVSAKAGIKIYDEITRISGTPITTRNQCYSLLALARQQAAALEIEIRRKEQLVSLAFDPSSQEKNYIYGAPFNDNFGLHLIGEGIRVSSIRKIFELVNRYKSKRPVFLTSMIIRPMLSKLLETYSFLGEHDVEFDLQVVPNNFLGGNIVMGDMLVLDDFRDFLNAYILEQDPDLVMLPSGPFNHGGWLRDMKGQPFELLKRSFSIPIEMIEAPYFE